MKMYEYRIIENATFHPFCSLDIDGKGHKELKAQLKILGEEGWLLITIYQQGSTMIFAREILET